MISQVPSQPVSINTLCLLAWKRAGVLPVEARLSGANMVPKLEHARQTLDLILDGLATEGFMARTTAFYDLPLVAGEPYYEMPDTVLEVFEDAMFIPSENPDTKHTTSEMVCTQVSLGTWQTLTTKGSISTRPQLYAVFRHGATLGLRFWPVPSEAGVMRVKTVRLFGGSGDGSGSPDLERFWHDALVWLLAWYLAVDSSMPPDRIAFLGAMAAQKKKEAVRFSFEPVTQQATVSYTTQWSS